MKRASYREAVAWIARNDEGSATDVDVIAAFVSVLLIADLFGTEADRIARDVVRYRKKHGIWDR